MSVVRQRGILGDPGSEEETKDLVYCRGVGPLRGGFLPSNQINVEKGIPSPLSLFSDILVE